MSPSLWFVVPAHGRRQLATICLRQLRRTCDALQENGVDATAVVIADDENLDTARELGFGTVRRDNRFLSRRFNDGIQLALDKRYNPRRADYVVPCGSDDFVDWRLFTDLPSQDTLLAFPNLSFVREDGQELRAVRLDYPGGAGIRVWPRKLLERVGFRPAAEDLRRGCDTSMLVNVDRELASGLKVEYRDTDPRQIVDWKSHGQNVNPYDTVATRWRGETLGNPWDALEDMYPSDALESMAAHYGALVPA